MKTRNIVAGILCLFAACAIYLLLRSDTIRLYRWVKATVGTEALDALREHTLGWHVPQFVRYSLPDGLWCMAYILIADAICQKEKATSRFLVASAIPLVAIAHEALQMAGMAQGTFDPSDMLCYIIPLTAYTTYLFTLNHQPCQTK